MSKVAFQKNTLVMRTENGVSSLYFDFNEQNPYNVGGEQVDVSGATLKVVLKMSNATQVTYNYSKNSNTTFNAASKLTVTGAYSLSLRCDMLISSQAQSITPFSSPTPMVLCVHHSLSPSKIAVD